VVIWKPLVAPVWLGAVSPARRRLALLQRGAAFQCGARRFAGMLFHERLSVPVLWWVLAFGFSLSLLLAIGLYVGPAWGIGAAAAALVVATWLFLHAAVVIVVDPQAIRIGRAEIDHRYIAGAHALDAEATRRRSGVEADARAHLVLRPYVAGAVEITLADPADPVPYWLVSSRRPAELAAALTRATGHPPALEHGVVHRPRSADAPDPADDEREAHGLG
jgi:hypothetical protein